jgi:hypothetical protein
VRYWIIILPYDLILGPQLASSLSHVVNAIAPVEMQRDPRGR